MMINFSNVNLIAAFRFPFTIAASLLLLSSCKNDKSESDSSQDALISVPELKHNNTGQTLNPSSFLLAQAHSRINWQPWSKEVFSNAAKEKKTIFAFIGSSTNSHSIETLKNINNSPATVEILNKSHVNVLIDADQYPELAFFVASLNAQMRSTVARTQLVWFSYEGIPISWSGIPNNSRFNVNDMLNRMSKTVNHLWQNDPSYVLENSRDDLKMRQASLTPQSVDDTDPLTTFRATRQAASLFNPISNSIDDLSNLSAARYTRLMALAATHPTVSEQQRKNYTKIATLATDNILLQGLIDPLDGGVFVGTQQSAGILPVFTKTLATQIWSMEALYALYQLTSDEKHLTAAEGISHYVENTLALPEGGYSLGIIYAGYGLIDNPCIWTLEEIEAALSQEETKLCIQAFGISGIGNIPLSDDSDRTYFRKNTMIWKTTLEELAKSNNLPPEELQIKLNSITKKLAKLRTEKTKHRSKNKLTTARDNAALASAYLTGYRATGEITKLQKAQQILEFIRENFITQSGDLRRCRFQGRLQNIPASGIDYAQVCSAALDMHEATLDPTWLDFASQIHQQMNTSLASDDLTDLLETDSSNHPHPFKVRKFITLTPLNNSNTWSLAYANAKRLSIRGKGEKNQLQAANLGAKITQISTRAPLASIDLLTSAALLERKTVYLKAPADQELLQAALPHHSQLILVTDGASYPGASEAISSLKAGQALVTDGSKVVGTAEDRESLQQLLR